jgi:mannose-6-phosphate isomerase-like protein (cupin superfamily)
MNVQEYIVSGILQEYCLGLLSEKEKEVVERNCRQYPAIQAALDACRRQAPDPALKETIWNLVENVNREEKGLEGLPVLNRFSERDTWLKMVQPFLPGKLEQDLFVRTIRDDAGCTQFVLWTKIDIPEEVHEDVQECFIVLDGKCECYVGDEVFRLSAGGFFEIPLHVPHRVKIISSDVLAVVQRMH